MIPQTEMDETFVFFEENFHPSNHSVSNHVAMARHEVQTNNFFVEY